MHMRSLKDEIIAELMERYGISKQEAESRWRTYLNVDEIGFVVSQRRKNRP